jgi:hypothetical protein
VSLYGSLLPPELNLHPVGHLNCPSFLFNNFQTPSSRRVFPGLPFHQVTNPSTSTVDFYPPFFSSTYKSLSPQLPSFQIYTKPPGWPTAPPRQSLARRVRYPLSTLFSVVCELFAAVAKLNFFLFSKIQTLSAKCRGYGISPLSWRTPGWPASTVAQALLPVLRRISTSSRQDHGRKTRRSVPSFEFRFSSSSLRRYFSLLCVTIPQLSELGGRP